MPKATPRPRAPRTPTVPTPPTGRPDPIVADLANVVAEILREALADGRKLMPIVETIRRDFPLLVVAAASPTLRAVTELAIREALVVLEAEAAARRKASRRKTTRPTA